MNYYLKDNDGGIKLYDTNKAKLQTSIKYHPELNDKTIYETEREIIELDGKFVFADEHSAEILAKAKAAKLAELSKIADCYDQYKCPIDMYIISSTGFKVDADIRSQTNMQGLVLMLEPGQTTQYKDFNNEFQEVSREQLETMIVECKQNGLNLYQQKFEYEAQINAAQTIEELDAIELVFEMMDFTKE